MTTKQAAAALGFAAVATWIALGLGSAIVCLLGAAAGWTLAALATGELDADELRARLDGARASSHAAVREATPLSNSLAPASSTRTMASAGLPNAAVALVLALARIACAAAADALSYGQRVGIVDPQLEVSCAQAQEALRADGAQVIDVREPYEWEAGRVPGARHIELERLGSSAETIDAARPVIFQCRAGIRSAMAAQAFRRAGYDAWSMAGGLEAWAAAGLPLEPRDGYVAPH